MDKDRDYYADNDGDYSMDYDREFERQYKKVCKQEIDFLVASTKRGPSKIEALAAAYIPDQLDEKLNLAFQKAFRVIMERGTGIIATSILKKEQSSADEAIFKSKISGLFDTAVTFAEGAGMGIIGLGLPDIPIFTAMIFRNIYQKAVLYGFGYESESEKLYMLKIIAGALLQGRAAERINEELDELAEEIDFKGIKHFSDEDEIEIAANAISSDMLYIKFVQGIPIVGAVGGIFNVSTIRRINKYAEIKYHKRYLLKNKE